MYFIDHLLNICKDATALTFFLFDLYLIRIGPFSRADINFRAEKRSAQASAHPLSQAQGGLFCDCVRQDRAQKPQDMRTRALASVSRIPAFRFSNGGGLMRI